MKTALAMKKPLSIVRAKASRGFFLPRMGRTPWTNFKLIFHLVVHAVPSMAELVRTWITWHFPVVPSVGTGCPLSAPAGSQGSVLGKGAGSFRERLTRKEGGPGCSFIWKLQVQNPSCVSQLGSFPLEKRRPQGEAIAVSQYLK